MIEQNTDSILRVALASGFGAALASVFGKLAFDETLIRLHFEDQPESVHLAIRGLCFVGIFLSNVVMMGLFARCLQRSTSLAATVSNCATNFCFTGVLGVLLFGEHLSATWLLGICSLLAGLFLISTDQTRLQISERKGQ